MGLLDSLISAESGGNPNATNPNSSATGPAQFLSSTWLDMMRKYRPDIQGSDSDLLAMRSDPSLSREMAANYATQNQKTLTDAGLPVTDGTTYLAHFAGPQGAVKVLQADPKAPVSDVLGSAVIKANPFLQGMTTSDLRAWADRKMGGAQPQSASPAVASGGGFGLPPQMPPTTAAPIFPTPQSPAAVNDGARQIMLGAAQQEQPQPSYWDQMPPSLGTMLPPIFAPPKRPPMPATRFATASGNRGYFFGRKV